MAGLSHLCSRRRANIGNLAKILLPQTLINKKLKEWFIADLLLRTDTAIKDHPTLY